MYGAADVRRASEPRSEAAGGAAYPRILRRRVLRGCNAHHDCTVSHLEVALGSLAGLRGTGALGREFAGRFIDYFAPAEAPLQGWPAAPGLAARLATPEGVPIETALLEAILAVETRALAAMFYVERIGYAAADRVVGAPLVNLLWESLDPEMSRAAAETALAGFAELVGGERPPQGAYDQLVRDLLQRAGRRRLSGSTSVLKAAAARRGLPCEAVSGQHLVIGQGARQQRLFSSLTGTTSFSAAKMSLDKRQCNRRLAGLSLPVPRQIGAANAEEAVAALTELGAPVVIKPSKGNQGRGVTVGVRGPDEARAAFEEAFAEESAVLVEEQVGGTDCRLVVVGGRFVAGLISRPPCVAGDGRRSLRELLDELNAEPDRDDIRLSPVLPDAALDQHLADQGLSLDSIPERGRTVTLRAHGHVATGGIPHDVTDRVHPDNRWLAERAATAIGLDVAGVDLITPDISRSYREVGGKVLEVNTRPGLSMHAWPRSGQPRDVAGAIVDLIFPEPADAFIPTFLVAGDRATAATARDAAKLLRPGGKKVGLALKDGAFLDGLRVEIPDSRIARAAALMARDPTVEALVAAISLRRAITHGLGLQACHGIAVLQEEGSDPAITREGLAVLARANRGVFVAAAGNAVARDALAGLGPERLVLVCREGEDPELAAHLAAGGGAVLRQWSAEGQRMRLVRGDRIVAEAPLEGRARTRQRNIEASMFAFGMVRGTTALR